MEFKVKVRVKKNTQKFNSRGAVRWLDTGNYRNIFWEVLIIIIVVADNTNILIKVWARKNDKFSFVRV